MTRRRYRKRAGRPIVAVRLNLDTPGFDYEKWGHTQHCKAGDWLVESGDDVYTVDADVFARTYERVSLGTYVKVAPVWAEKTQEPGVIATKEGSTAYAAGDYLVSNDERGTDSWAIPAAKFADLYEPEEAE